MPAYASRDPATDPHLTVWRVTQQLIRALDERKGWAQQAMAYNSLVIAWPRIVQLAGQQTATTAQQQNYLDQV
jgi:hypothetical protein